MHDPFGIWPLELEHYKRLDKYVDAVNYIYESALKEAIKLGLVRVGPTNKPFSFDYVPETKKRFEQILKKYSEQLQTIVTTGIKQEWEEANKKTDVIVDKVKEKVDLTDYQKAGLYARQTEALSAFIDRVDPNGLSLSKRVWNLSNQFKSELEMLIDLGISDGTSAAKLATQAKQYLNYPDKLFRRVRDKYGVLHLSKNAAAFHPGQGVYRSSYKNAMRMTRTEINMSYRMADHSRRQALPFIAGIEVVLSNNHPVLDICDDLKGKYPKEFIFRGWHPQCRCHTISILAPESQWQQLIDADFEGEDVSGMIKNPVRDTPQGFKGWISDNKERIENWKSKPYFMIDNPGFVKNIEGLSPRQINEALKNKKVTLDIFNPSRKGYTLERQKLHDRIINEYIKGGTSNTNTIYMLGGAPANGKSTLVNSGALPHPKNALVIDADKIKRMLPEYKYLTGIKDTRAANFVHEESSHISKKIMNKIMNNKGDFVLDAVNDGEFEKVRGKINIFKNKGYKVRADYTTLDTNLSLQLAEARAKKEMREVPRDYIVDMNSGISKLIPKLIKGNNIDELYLWDTNTKDKAQLILSFINGKTKIHNKELFERFLNKAN